MGPLGWPLIKFLGPQFWDSVYIFEVKGAKNVKSDAQVAMNKNSDPVHFFYLEGGSSVIMPILH